MHLEATVRLNAMAFRLEELIADRWFSTRQASLTAPTMVQYIHRLRSACDDIEMHSPAHVFARTRWFCARL